jgi:dTDP-glucose pyrophosphorylase
MKKLIIENKITIKDALQKLESNNHKCLLVVNKFQKFIGTLNDGDIRRAILKGAKVQSKVDEHVRKNPVFLKENQKKNSGFLDKNNRMSHNLLKKIDDNKIDLVPVLDKKFKIKEIIFKKDVKNFLNISQNNKIPEKVPAIIMAGGEGTRLKQFTNYFPKPLVPFQDTTATEHIIKTFKNYGVKKIIMSVNYKKNLIKSYLNENKIKNVSFINEKKPMGSAGSLSLLRGKLKNNFFVINCDTLLNINLKKFYDFHINNNYFLTLVAAHKSFELSYGTCEIKKNGELNKIKEKPKLDYLANVGLYLFKPEILKYVKKNTPLEMDNLIKLIKNKKKKIGVFPISENSWIDTGSPNKEEKSF